jgi:hypothetical protein
MSLANDQEMTGMQQAGRQAAENSITEGTITS